jgi:ABC-type phosphate transport system substrate-binding protein
MKNIVKLILISISFSSFFAVADVVVIVHPSNESKIKRVDIKKIFLGKSTLFRNGNTAKPINLIDSPETRRFFNKKLLSRSHAQVVSIWSKLEFTSTGTPPAEKSTSEVLRMVASDPEMIGYIDSSQVTSDVKVVMTIE